MKDLFKFPLDIQYYAEDANEDTGAEDNNQGEDEGAKDEKTFTQAEVNELIAKEKARARNQAKKQVKKKVQENTKDEVEEPSQEIVNPYLERYAQAEIKVAMAQQGVDATKVNRAVRLIDFNNVLTENGDIDTEKMNGAITELLEEWPELAPATNEDNVSFKIGSDKDKQKGKDADVIANAFGNKN